MSKKLNQLIDCLQENAEIKMSEIILHLADDLLINVHTKKAYLQFIGMVCFAWNLSVLFNPEQQKFELKQVLQDLDDPKERQAVKNTIRAIIRKKQLYYPYINRVILQYDLKGNRKNLRLNIISASDKRKNH